MIQFHHDPPKICEDIGSLKLMIKFISYFEPLKETIGRVKYQLSNCVFNDAAF
jgi:hypothetical protein